MRKIWIRIKQRSPHHAPRAEYFVYESGWWQGIPLTRALDLLEQGRAEMYSTGELELQTLEVTHRNSRYIVTVEREDLNKNRRFWS
jgi:hypothetical protein